jgi:hypothetical protein
MCCVQNQNLHLNKIPINQPVDDHWNSEFMRQTRLMIADGILPDTCEGCTFNESVGILSRRHKMNQRYLGIQDPELTNKQVQKLLQQTNPDGSFDLEILGVEIGGDNTCQLRCIQCSPSYSKSINKDYEKLGWDHKRKNRLPIEVIDHGGLDQLFENLKPLVPKLNYLKFVGGEPSISKPLATFMDWCIENNHAKNIFLLCTTNAANVKDSWIDKLLKFNRVVLGISVDGVGGLDEWIRWPTNWEKKEKNIKKLMDSFPDAYIATTLFSLNIHKLDEIIYWCRENNYRHMIERLNWPEELSIKQFPSDTKEQLSRQLLELADSLKGTSINDDSRMLVDHYLDTFIRQTVDFMNQNNSTMWDQCVNTIKSYNNIRNSTLGDHNDFWKFVE